MSDALIKDLREEANRLDRVSLDRASQEAAVASHMAATAADVIEELQSRLVIADSAQEAAKPVCKEVSHPMDEGLRRTQEIMKVHEQRSPSPRSAFEDPVVVYFNRELFQELGEPEFRLERWANSEAPWLLWSRETIEAAVASVLRDTDVRTSPRNCTCHPDEAPVPCQGEHAYTHCRLKFVEAQLAAKDAEIASLKMQIKGHGATISRQSKAHGIDIQKLAAATKRLEDCEAAIAEYYRYQTGGETRGSYDGKPERSGLWKAMYGARAFLASNPTPEDAG